MNSLLNNSSNSSQVTQAYVAYINSFIDYSDLLSDLNIDSKSLEELISAKGDLNSDIITVSVIGNSEDQTVTIAKFISSKTEEALDKIKSQYGEHTIIFSELSTSTITDSNLLSTVSDKMLSPNSAMNDVLTKVNTLQATLTSQQKSLTSLTYPSNVQTIIIKDIVKFSLTCAAVSLVCIIFILAANILISNKILDEEEIYKMFGIKLISVFPMKYKRKKMLFIDHIIYKKIDSSYRCDDDIVLDRTVANIEQYSNGNHKILLIFTNENTRFDITKFKDKFIEMKSDTFTFETSNCNGREFCEQVKLKNADSVIIIAERNVTKINDLSRIVEITKNWEKPIIGSIIL